MSTVFVQPQDLVKIRELRLRQEIAQTQAQSHGYAMQAELGRLYLRLGLAEDDSINIDTGVVTIAHHKPQSDPDLPGNVPILDRDPQVVYGKPTSAGYAGKVLLDGVEQAKPGEAQTTGDPTFAA